MLVVHLRRHTGEKPHRCTVNTITQNFSANRETLLQGFGWQLALKSNYIKNAQREGLPPFSNGSTVMLPSTAIIGHKNPLKLKSCSSPLTIVLINGVEKQKSIFFYFLLQSQVLFALREIVVGRHVAHLRLHPRGVTTSQDALYKNKARASILCEHYLAEIAIIPLIVHDRSSVD